MHEKLLAYLGANRFSTSSKHDLNTCRIKGVPKRYLTWAREQLDVLTSLGGCCIASGDSNYPKSLKDLADMPPLLFVLGAIPDAYEQSVAVVGARKCSVYGESIASQIGSELAGASLTLVSGLASGVDEATHRGFLEQGCSQVAVIGSGFSHLYPKQNTKLARQIVEKGGAVVSEYPPATPPHPYNFPARNRIIAALSRKLIVVEAKKKSGSLITADFSLDLGRDVFVVPGQINSSFSEGTNKLLNQGASPYLGLDSLGVTLRARKPDKVQVTALSKKLIGLPDNYKNILFEIQERGVCSFDELCQFGDVRPHKLRVFISDLEISGVVRVTKTDHIVSV